MKNLVCFTEEPSAVEMLRCVLPRILPADFPFLCFHFEGKQDLEKRIANRIQYWVDPDSVFLVLRDQDSDDCYQIKNELIQKIRRTGKSNLVIVRIACHELESFYLGDLQAVEKGLEIKGLAKKQGKALYRAPDELPNPAQQLMRLTENRYQKLKGSRAISPWLSLDCNASHSFCVLIAGVKKFCGIE